MGLKNWVHNKRMSDPVDGTYRLTSCSGLSGGADYENCRMHGVVVAPGVEAFATEHKCMAPGDRWPYPGQTLPVTVDRADPTRMHIEWSSLRVTRDVAQAQAEQLAASMRGEQAGAQPSGSPSDGSPFAGSPFAGFSGPVTMSVHETVVGAPGRPVPGQDGGGLTPEQSAGAGTAPGMQRATARVLATHEVTMPPGMPGAPPAGLVDLTLDVSPPNGDGYTVTTRIAFSTPEKRSRIATVGIELPVFIDPQARDRIAIDGASLGL